MIVVPPGGVRVNVSRDFTLWSCVATRHIQNELDLRYFRGDNAYVLQQREMLTELNYLLTAYGTRWAPSICRDMLGKDGISPTGTTMITRMISRRPL